MAINYPGPFEVRVNYLTNEVTAIANHQLRLSFDCGLTGSPGDPFSSWKPIDKAGSSVISLATKVTDLVTTIKASFVAAVTFVDAELWEYDPGTFDAIYRSTLPLAVVGTGAGSTVPYGQAIWTWRNALGGIMKMDLRGTIHPAAARVALPSTAQVAAVNTYMLASTTPWWGRDNSFPIAGLYFLAGLNERAFKVVNR